MRSVAILIFPGFQLLDAAGPIAAFEMATREAPDAYQLQVAAAEPGMVESSSGVAMRAKSLETVGPVDTLVVVGGQGTRQAMDCEKTRAFVNDTCAKARRITSICSGAFVLAAAGLLDGRRATTHWNVADVLAHAFPKVTVESDRIFVRDGHVWTSAGVTAGIDLCLALIEEDLGEAAARRVAQELVVFHRRPGGQSQFSALLQIAPPQSRFSDLLTWVRAHLGEALTVERLAQEAAVSPRHFSRLFTRQMGVSPAKAIERLRLEAAREAVECTAEPIDAIARRLGFGEPERMRRAFIRGLGQPPQAMRRMARR